MDRVVVALAVIILGYLTIVSYGEILGFTGEDIHTVEQGKEVVLDKTEPYFDPIVSKIEITKAERKVREALPSSEEVKNTLETQVVPSVVRHASDIGNAMIPKTLDEGRK